MLRTTELILNGGSPDKIAVVNSDDTNATYGYIRTKTVQFINTIQALDASNVMISCSHEATAIAAFLACMNCDVNFGVCPYVGEDTDELSVKNAILSTDLLISDYHVDRHILTVGSEGIDRVGYEAGMLLGGTDSVSNIMTAVNAIFGGMLGDSVPIIEVYPTEKLFYNFHKGIDASGYKFSIFTKDKVDNGIEKSLNLLYEEDLTFFDKFEMLYDILNGVLSPISHGYTVKFCNTATYETLLYSMYGAKSIYSSAYTFERALELIIKNSSYIKWLRRHKLTKRLAGYLIKKAFSSFSNKLDRIILTGKIRRISDINSLRIPVTTMYTMGEIASFVSLDTHKKLAQNYAVGFVNLNHVQIAARDGKFGGVMVYTNDMAVSTNDNYVKDSFMHKYLGRLNTRDIGYMQDGKLHIVDKDSFVYEYFNGTIVNTGIIVNKALNSPWCSDAMLVSDNSNKLVLLVSPDNDYASKHHLRLEDIEHQAAVLEGSINRSRNGAFPVSVRVWTGKNGLDRDTYKIIVRGAHS